MKIVVEKMLIDPGGFARREPELFMYMIDVLQSPSSYESP